MEKEVKIKTKDNHLIYGVLNTPKRKTNKVIVFVHGLTEHKNAHQFYNAARFFPKRGFTTFRFDLYSGEKGGRKLSKTTIKIQAKDLNTVVRYFRKRFKKIFVVGHSIGGVTILLSDTNQFDGITLWDSSSRLSIKSKKYFKYDKCLDVYLLGWGAEFVIGKKMYNEWFNFPPAEKLMKDIHKPIKVIVAEKGGLIKAGKEYFKYAKKPKSFAIIKNAGHTFNEEGVEEKLFKETLGWFKKL